VLSLTHKHIHALYALKLKKNGCFTLRDNIFNIDYRRVKPENIKLKHYMYNGLSIYQTKRCKTTILALPRLSYIIFNRRVVGKTTLYYGRSCSKPIITTELQQNLQKHINICCCGFKKILIKRKNYTAKKFNSMINCDL